LAANDIVVAIFEMLSSGGGGREREREKKRERERSERSERRGGREGTEINLRERHGWR
jgi:hypothetical protein